MERNKYEVKKVMMRDLGLCRCCGFKASEVHHIVPLVYGGKDDATNMVALCGECHSHAPNTKKEFKEYIERGGHKLAALIGIAIIEMEKNNLDFQNHLPICKKIIASCREIDRNAAFEKYSIKESLEIEDIDWSDCKDKTGVYGGA